MRTRIPIPTLILQVMLFRMLKRASCVRDYVSLHCIYVNGEETCANATKSWNEDLTDAGGLRWAFKAFQKLNKRGRAAEKEFFIAHALQYCERSGVIPRFNALHSPACKLQSSQQTQDSVAGVIE